MLRPALNSYVCVFLKSIGMLTQPATEISLLAPSSLEEEEIAEVLLTNQILDECNEKYLRQSTVLSIAISLFMPLEGAGSCIVSSYFKAHF